MVQHCKSCRQEKEPSEFRKDSRDFKTCNVCRVKKGLRRLTLDDCKIYAEGKGGLCSSEEYKNNRTSMKWRCGDVHEWLATFDSIKRGSWCPHCAGTAPLSLKECQEFALNKGGECVSTNYKNNNTNMKWKCSDGHKWVTPFSIIKNNGAWCPHCAEKAPLSLEQCQELAISKGGKCLSTEYKNTKTKMNWQCSDGHEWTARFSDIKKGSWCPQCSSGRSEQLCREIFEEEFGKKFPNVRPKFLNGLELDGYCEELNLAFEYNGQQHYEYIPHFHRNGMKDFENQQERDRRKYKICAKKDIKLILIPYQFDYRKPEALKNYIIDACSDVKF